MLPQVQLLCSFVVEQNKKNSSYPQVMEQDMTQCKSFAPNRSVTWSNHPYGKLTL